MEWMDRGIFLSGTLCGEQKYIITVFTEKNGLKKGLINNKKNQQMLQPGVVLHCKWNARLQEHLGMLKAEVEFSPIGKIFFTHKKIIFLKTLANLLCLLLPEGYEYKELYQRFYNIIHNIHFEEFNVIREYIAFEFFLIKTLGFAINLESNCTLCKKKITLYYFSPKSGKGCCKECGDIYSNKLLVFNPQTFMKNQEISFQNCLHALELTGFYLLNHVIQGKNQQKIIDIRNNIINLIQEEKSAA